MTEHALLIAIIAVAVLLYHNFFGGMIYQWLQQLVTIITSK